MRTQAGFFSLTPPPPPDDDGSYLRWHLLDHMPEQYQIPGIVHGLRWIADGDYPDHRIAGEGPLGGIGNVVHYLIGEPVSETFVEFARLGRTLRETGRFPVSRPSLQVAGMRLLQYYAAPQALISAEVVPFRPHRGIVLIVEEPTDATAGRPNEWLRWLRAQHYPALLSTPGVAGAWTFGATKAWNPVPQGWRTDLHYTTVVYLDGDPLATSDTLVPLLEDRWRSEVRAVFAGPLRTMTSWDAWP